MRKMGVDGSSFDENGTNFESFRLGLAFKSKHGEPSSPTRVVSCLQASSRRTAKEAPGPFRGIFRLDLLLTKQQKVNI